VERSIDLFPKQIDFFNLTCREALFDAGIGNGKSTAGAFWLATQVLTHKKTRWLMIARDYKQLRSATMHEFLKVLTSDKWLGLKEGVHFTHNKSNSTFKFFNGSSIDCFGANNYDSNLRGGNYSGAWGDEVDFWPREAYMTLKGRIRVAPELIRFTSSPKGFNFVWEDFYQNKDSTKEVINATTYDNPTLSMDYTNSLKKSYSPRLFEQEVLGKRLLLQVGCVYDEFKRDKHVRPCTVTDQDQIYVFTDYNISNYCATYVFFRNGIVHAFDEEHLKFKGSRDLAQRIRMKYPRRPIIIVGDSSGNNKRDVAIEKTNYEIFKEYNLTTEDFHNPPVQSRIIGANSNFYHSKVVIDPSCVNLIRDLELVAWVEGKNEVDKSDITLTHSSDGFTYGLWYFLPLEAPRPKSRSFTV
jgi:hypothetical protein